ncbi:hypothetical protein V5O48_006844 [Marasmius crinis-equi]|uniref:Uncharacterized protein n=1 Tax=Marasmius crinis-equi TaxID=585013 RepID=A0ABR3FIE7_9AGAR
MSGSSCGAVANTANTTVPSKATVAVGRSRKRSDILQYLDLEADVDDDDEGERTDDDLDGFLTGGGDDDDSNNNNELGLREFSHRQVDLLLEREHLDIVEAGVSVDGHVAVNHTVIQTPGGPVDGETDRLPPKELWLIRCKHSKQPFNEWKVLNYALGHANTQNTTIITSLHYRKDGDGLLYLDTFHPSQAARILAESPSVLRSRDSSYSGINMHRLENLAESKNSLFYPPEPVTRGSWVRITNATFKGVRQSIYDGDLGLVTNMDLVDGSVQVAFVCRSDNSKTASVVEHAPAEDLKRGPEFHSRHLITEEMMISLDKLPALGTTIEHGLRLEWVANGTAVLISEPPSPLDIGLFVSSGHPLVLESFPRVQGWIFREGEMVETWDGRQRGRVCAITEAGVEIITASSRGSSAEEQRGLGWRVNKCWNLGDYVEHTTGHKGLIVGFEGYLVYFWMGGEEENDNKDDPDIPYAGHRNALKSVPRVSDVDALLARRSENATIEWLMYNGMSQREIEQKMSELDASRASFSDPLLLTPAQVDPALSVSRTFTSPWKWWEVLIWHGPRRGYHRVFDVLVGQKTKSGLKVQVQSTVVNALGHIFAVDYDDVVDAELLLPLHCIRAPAEAFRPPHGYCHPGIRGLGKQRSRLRLGQQEEPVERAVTPPPLLVSSSEEAAWNPDAPPPQELSIAAFQPPDQWWKSNHSSQHEFYELDPRTADAVRFQVSLVGIVTDLKNKTYSEKSPTQTIFFDATSGRRTLTVSWMRAKGRLPPDMVVQPQRPSNKASLPLVVMRGEHKDMVATKVSGVGGDIWVNPVSTSTGVVDKTSVLKVSGRDCCSVRLRTEELHSDWEKETGKKVKKP